MACAGGLRGEVPAVTVVRGAVAQALDWLGRGALAGVVRHTPLLLGSCRDFEGGIRAQSVPE